LERFGDVRHDGRISTQANVEEKVLPALSKAFRWSLPLSRDLHVLPGGPRQSQALHRNMSKVNPACLTLKKSQSRFDRVLRQTDGCGPFIVRTTWDVPDQGLSSGLHHPVHHAIEGPITPVADDQVAALSGCLPGQFQRLAPVG